MTATQRPPAAPPAAAGQQPTGHGSPGAKRPAPHRPTLRLPAELSLWVVTAAAAFSFSRLFVDLSYLPPVLVATATSHLVAAGLRRRRVPVPLAAAASLVAMVLVCTWLFYFFTTRVGLPTGLTWDTFTADLREAVTRFREDQAPVDPVRGFVAGSAVGFWLVAFLADWSAFRLWAPVESTIPAGSLFVFASLLGADRSRVVVTAVFFLAAVGFLLLHRTARLEMSPSWVRGDGQRGARAQLAVGGGITAIAVLAVAVVGPLMPGATSAALLDVKDIGNDNDTRVTVSPLVDIRQRLVDNKETEVFRVTSDQHSYWRLTALDEFDGRVWRSSRRFEKVAGDLPQASSRPFGNTAVVTQTFSVSALAQIWLPAAFEAMAVNGMDREVRWEPNTSTLIVDDETSDGLEYEVTSALTDYDPATLQAARGTIPSRISEEFLPLPRNFPGSVEDLARQVTANATSDYDRAKLLQDYFRANYTYSTDVTGGQDIDAIEEFLFSDIRAGYCEQFAGSYAAMARSIGLPARVAVGFTLGDPLTDEPTTYVVKGRHAHAWPEVYLAGIGWVLFEPTPNRGAPNAGYTGTRELQDSDVAPEGVTTTTAPSTTVDPTLGGPPIPEFPIDGASTPAGELESDGGSAGTARRATDSTGARIVLVLLLLLVVYVIVVPVLHRVRRIRRRSAAHSSNARIGVAWSEAGEALELLGVRLAVGETPAEFAVRADNRSRAGTQMRELAGLTTAARYGPDASADREADRAVALAAEVVTAVRGQTTTGERIQAELDPRPALRRWWRRAARGAETDDDDGSHPERVLVGSGSGTPRR